MPTLSVRKDARVFITGQPLEPRDLSSAIAFPDDSTGEDLESLSLIFISPLHGIPIVRALGRTVFLSKRANRIDLALSSVYLYTLLSKMILRSGEFR